MILILIPLIRALDYQFQAQQPYLLIQVFTQEYDEIMIGITQSGVQIAQLQIAYDTYLELYQKIQVNQTYNWKVSISPYNATYNITQVAYRQCPNQCSQQGSCTAIQCQCNQQYAGNRCQFQVQQIYDPARFVEYFMGFQTQVIQIYFAQQYLQDSTGNLNSLQLSSNLSCSVSVYLLMPSQYPNLYLQSGNLVYNGTLTSAQQSLSYSRQFINYNSATAQYSFVIVMTNTLPWQQYIQVQYSFQSQTQGFHDFILVSILSVIAFIILLIVVYVIRRRCLFIQRIQKPQNQSLLESFPVVIAAKDMECVICLEQLDQLQCRMVPCKHVIHEVCLQKWMEKQMSCPLCREPLFDDQSQLKSVMRATGRNVQSNGSSFMVVNSERVNSVRQIIFSRSRQSRLAVYQ